MKEKIIKFTAKDPYVWEVHPKPIPAKKYIPDWWKNSPQYEESYISPDGKDFGMISGNPNFSFKKCIPMIDAISYGYIIPLWTDLYVENDNSVSVFSWKAKASPSPVVTMHQPSSKKIEEFPGYGIDVYKYHNGWIPQTPKGYSLLITSPLGHYSLPMKAIPAIVDSDSAHLSDIPFRLKNGFSGVIEKGTPIVQIIPFKKDSWVSEFDSFDSTGHSRLLDRTFNSTIFNHYIKKCWNRVTFK